VPVVQSILPFDESSIFIGADVSKSRLDVHGLEQPLSVPNDRRGIARLIGRLRKSPPRLIVVEATGGYERPLVRGAIHAGLSVVNVNPLRIRRFAQSRGVMAKTDRIDAAILADFGRLNADRLRPMRPVSDNAVMLREWIARRRQLIEQCVANKSQLEHVTVHSLRQSIDRTIKHLCGEISAVEVEIQKIIDEDEQLRVKQEKLRRVVGIGPRVSRVLVSELPELGELDRRQIASLVNDDSGKHTGQRHIRGGRATVRAALYMATLVAVRHDPVIGQYYQRLKSNGKPKKVALVACMRKRLNYLTAILRTPPTQAAERNEAGS
jgi:transposase